ncbi:MAG TPA: nucleotidyl transferase AbiEii/AbiGii toxin family protein [Terracidiphilus sp.]|nr:nucleotidyl transferase AbiEii/AbiGii toxin family protein [Terracidiphilus sp.]
MSRFQPHLDILPPAQRKIWPLLAPSARLGFVLYGGTAIALRLGHRSSVDFDFFTDKPLDRRSIEGEFVFFERSKVIQDHKDTLSLLTPLGSEDVRISFFGDIAIGRVGIPDRTPDGVLYVASVADLMATKLKVIQQRIESKDYRDLAAILRSGANLEVGLASAAALYGPSFQPSEAMKALTYFEGGDLAALDAVDKKALIDAVARVRHVPLATLASKSLSA